MNLDSTVLMGLLGVTLCLYYVKSKTRARRRFKVRPINTARKRMGGFQYYKNMKTWDKEQFFKYTRMTHIAFEKLLQLIKSQIQRQLRSDGISPEERLVITLQ